VLVSIITPSKDFEINKKTLESIENQTNKNFEWVIVFDDQTTGRGLEILIQQVMLRESDYVKTVYLNKNYGPSTARNVGVQISTGDIITYLDNGDELNKDRVQHIIEIYESHPNVEILFDGYTIIQNGTYFYNILDIHNALLNKYDRGIVNKLKTQNITIPLGVSHKRRPFVEVGGFQPGIVCGEDGILWRRMCDRIEGKNIMFSNFNAGNYYVSQTGQSRTQRRFSMGGYAFDGSKNDNGVYLDKEWFENFSSKGLYDDK
jgi:glycosyltransferase involved in cell wall biosynthesis